VERDLLFTIRRLRYVDFEVWCHSFIELTMLKAVSTLLHKQAPGLVHGMLAASLNVTPCEYLLILARLDLMNLSCAHVKASSWST
jgi:hypothetical protein